MMKIKATNLRVILTMLIIFMVAGSSIGFYFAQSYIQKYAKSSTDTSTTTIGASQQDIITLKKKLGDLESTIGKASNIFSDRGSYQTSAAQDIKKYASDSGVKISGELSFSRPTNDINELQIFSGASLTSPVLINIENPVEFSSFIKFINLIETNLPIMQISGINIRRVEGSKTAITTEPIFVEVYTK